MFDQALNSKIEVVKTGLFPQSVDVPGACLAADPGGLVLTHQRRGRIRTFGTPATLQHRFRVM